MYTALSIAFTLPLLPEIAFSKLKLLNHFLISIMPENRLEAHMIIACELTVKIDTANVIKYV